MRKGGLVGFGGAHGRKKMAFEGRTNVEGKIQIYTNFASALLRK